MSYFLGNPYQSMLGQRDIVSSTYSQMIQHDRANGEKCKPLVNLDKGYTGVPYNYFCVFDILPKYSHKIT